MRDLTPTDLARLITERAPGLVLYARQWLDEAAAEDVLQEALTALLARRPPPADPLAWTCRAVRNAAVDQVRSRARRRRRERVAAQARPEVFDPSPDALIDAAAANRALANLPEISREVVVLRIWADLSFTQIAQALRLSVSTVHNRYTSALKQLRSHMETSCKTNRT